MIKIKTHLNRVRNGAMSAIAAALLVVGVQTSQASTDYGPAFWRPPCNANYNTSGSGHKFHVVHDMEGYYWSVISMFNACGYTGASVHYLTNGKKDNSSDAAPGEVTQSVRDSQYAWHARCWNTHSTGTEHEGFVSNPAWYTEEQYVASAAITRHLSTKFGWAKDRNHVIGHDQKRIAGWPAYASGNLGIDPYCNDHTDPGLSWNWSHYMDLVNGGGIPPSLPTRPAICSRSTGKLDVFGLGIDGTTMFIRSWDGAAWSPWLSMGGGYTSGPGACSRSTGMLDMVGRGWDNAYYLNTWNGTAWSGSYSIGGQFSSAPAICSRASGKLDVFGLGIDGTTMFIRSWDGAAWSPWLSMGAGYTSAPAACSRSTNMLDLVGRGSGNAYYLNTWNGTSWSGSYSLGGQFSSAPAVCSRADGKLDIFGVGIDGTTLFINSWNGSTWSGWFSMGSGYTSGPAACSRSTGWLDVVGRGTDSAYYINTWNSTSWSGSYSIGGQFY